MACAITNRRCLARTHTGQRRSAIDKVIITTLLIIAGVVAAVLVISAVYPAIATSSGAILRISDTVDTRIETQISVVYATAELDSSQVWQDGNSNTFFDVFVWVKNVGSAEIVGLSKMDVFYGTDGNFERIPHESDAPASFPRWSYTIENGTRWLGSITAKISIHYSAAQTTGTYFVKVVTPSSVSDTHYFSF